MNDELDDKVETPSDFAVIVRGLPKNWTSIDLKNMIEGKFKG